MDVIGFGEGQLASDYTDNKNPLPIVAKGHFTI